MYDTSILFFIAERGWWKFFCQLSDFPERSIDLQDSLSFFLPTLVKLWLSRL